MHAARGTAAAFYTTHHNSIHFTWISYVSMPSIAAQKIKKNTLELFGAVQEPVRPDPRESYPMGQGRTWRTLDAAAQIYGQVPIGIIRTEIPLHLRRPHGVRHEVVQDDEHIKRIRVRSRSQPRLEILDVRPFSP